jgi:hypothetical protein
MVVKMVDLRLLNLGASEFRRGKVFITEITAPANSRQICRESREPIFQHRRMLACTLQKLHPSRGAAGGHKDPCPDDDEN